MTMSTQKPISVKLDFDVYDKIEDFTYQSGIKTNRLINIAIDFFIEFEKRRIDLARNNTDEARTRMKQFLRRRCGANLDSIYL